jgi:hypothetical protein
MPSQRLQHPKLVRGHCDGIVFDHPLENTICHTKYMQLAILLEPYVVDIRFGSLLSS